MVSKLGILGIVISLLAACTGSSVSVEQQFVEDVAAALGGRNTIEAIETLQVEAEGRSLNLGQDLTPESMTMKFAISDYTLDIDLANGSNRTTQTRTPLFNYYRGPAPVKQVFGVDSNIAYDIAADGKVKRGSDSTAAERQSTFYHHPLILMHAVLKGKATASNLRQEDGFTLADITTSEGQNLTVAVDPATMLPAHISSRVHHYYLRDVVSTTSFSDYVTVGEMTLPSTLNMALDEFNILKLQLLTQSVNGQIGDTSAPAEIASTAPTSGGQSIEFSVEKIDDGVWFLAGWGYNSVVIEFSDHLMIVEAPNKNHTLSALEKAKELAPGKPVTQLVNSHYHFDHSGGVRTAISEGLTVITHATNETFYRRMAEQPSAIVPDTLSQNPRDIEIEVFDEKATYQDDSMTVELYHLKGSPHNSSLLMVYLPKQRLLIEGDAFTPDSSAIQTSSPNLLENIQRYGLDVDRIAPLHNRLTNLEELKSAVQALQNIR